MDNKEHSDIRKVSNFVNTTEPLGFVMTEQVGDFILRVYLMNFFFYPLPFFNPHSKRFVRSALLSGHCPFFKLFEYYTRIAKLPNEPPLNIRH